MSLPFSQGKLQGKERKNVLQAVQEQAKAAAREAIKPVLQEFLETEVCAKLGREKGAPRHISGQPREIDWQCGHCGCQDANQFIRDGHYRRGLETGWGHLSDLRVPMVECQQCQHDVVTQFAILEKYKRFWMDLDQDVLFSSGFCESLRQIKERWSATVENNVSLRTLNERINQIEPLAKCAHTEALIVALGFWANGRREILDWQIARSEDHQEWEVFVQRLWERGCQPKQGLQLVVRDGSGGLGEALALIYGSTVPEQRCIFHKLQNVATKCRSELKGKDNRDLRKQLMEQAAAVYQAETADEARNRLAQWGKQWREQALQSVATLERDFEQTLVFYRIAGLALQWIRTTSLLERTNRELRRKFRQAITFGSHKGAEVAIYLQIQRLHARWTGRSWWETSHTLFFELWNLNP